ncbi:MAG: hypothetical protein Q4G33_11640 [bacterium]|nr:hypothetical protein [bacterium]
MTREEQKQMPQYEQLAEELKDVERLINRNIYIIKSAEGKLERVDPLSAEFEEVVGLIENTKAEQLKLSAKQIALNHKLANIKIKCDANIC